MEDCVILNKKEAEAVVELLDQLSGGNPENVFAWDGSDDLADATTSAVYKLFKACGKNVPANLKPAKE